MPQQTSEAVQAVLATLGLPGLRVLADQEGIALHEGHADGKYRFAQALQLALEAFLHNATGSPAQGHDSAVAVVRSAPDQYGLDTTPSAAAIAEALRTILASDPDARIVLLTSATIAQQEYRFLPEYGESITENWVFRIVAPASWPLLQWSIVKIRGEVPAYSYGFG